MQFTRGEIYRVRIPVKGPGGAGTRYRDKFIVILRDLADDDPFPMVHYVICSTDTDPNRTPRAHECRIGPSDADCLDAITIIDGRHVCELTRAAFENHSPRGTLDTHTMNRLGDAIGAALQLYVDDD